jgi:GNAT superfamily N-acetyltransferase
MDVDALVEQSMWDLFWLPGWASVVDRPELLYTWSARDQPALNQVLRVRAGADLGAMVAEVSAAHEGVFSRWLLGRDSQLPELPPHLERAGWRFEYVHHLRTRSGDGTPLLPSSGVVVRDVCDAATLTDCIRVQERAFGSSSSPITPDRIADELAALRRPGDRVHRFVAYDESSGCPMSSGGINVFAHLGIAFLWGGGTDPDLRGRGAYRALLAARLARATALGCRRVAAYAREDTSDPFLDALGFERHGTMVSWARAPQCSR